MLLLPPLLIDVVAVAAAEADDSGPSGLHTKPQDVTLRVVVREFLPRSSEGTIPAVYNRHHRAPDRPKERFDLAI